jgi:hypothetical protein
MRKQFCKRIFHCWQSQSQIQIDTIAIFCAIDDFCKGFESRWNSTCWRVIAKITSVATRFVSKSSHDDHNKISSVWLPDI